MSNPAPHGAVPPSPDAARAVAAFEAARAGTRRARRLREGALAAAFVIVFAASAKVGEIDLGVLANGLPNLLDYVSGTMPVLRADTFRQDLAEWYWALPKWLGLLWDTMIIAFLGTLLGVLGALVLCFPGSRNLMRRRSVYFAARRVAEVARAVPELVYALLFVFAFGIGPLPGVLAIAIHTAGALGKLFAEVNENAAPGPIEGVRAAGGGWLQVIRYAVMPQVLPNYLSYGLLRFEINVRSAAVIGFVGAGGIGQELMFVIRQFVYTDISAIVLMILVTVAAIDIACESLRRHLILGGAPT